MSETFGRADKPSTYSPPSGYLVWNKERSGTQKGGGGLSLLYRENLIAHEWSPTVPQSYEYIEKERQWLLLKHGDSKCAFLHCYIACQGQDDSFVSWNDDLFTLMKDEAVTLKAQGFFIFAMGDFNTILGQIPGLEGNVAGTNRNQPMFINFISEVNLGMTSH